MQQRWPWGSLLTWRCEELSILTAALPQPPFIHYSAVITDHVYFVWLVRHHCRALLSLYDGQLLAVPTGAGVILGGVTFLNVGGRQKNATPPGRDVHPPLE